MTGFYMKGDIGLKQVNHPEFVPSESDKVRLFAEIFFENSNDDDSGSSLPAFPFKINLELYNFYYSVQS